MKRALAFAALAAFVACGPRWTLEDRSDPRGVTLAPAGITEGVVDIEASHPISSVRTLAEDISVASGHLRIEQSDAREGCSVDATFDGSEGKWNRTPAAGNVNLTENRIELASECPATEHAAKVTIRITNGGTKEVTFRWRVVATTTGEGGSDPPSDAFIRVRAE